PDRVIKKAETFSVWLEKRGRSARKMYSKKEWNAILHGPAPFTPKEEKIVAARRRFRWRVVGITESGDLHFEGTNGSDRGLPVLSIGIRGRDGLEGGVYLAVSHLEPGETAVVVKDAYKDLIPPTDVEAYALPDPEPEDRECYWEFR